MKIRGIHRDKLDTIKNYFLRLSLLFSGFFLIFTISLLVSAFVLRSSAKEVVKRGLPIITHTNEVSERSVGIRSKLNTVIQTQNLHSLEQAYNELKQLINELSESNSNFTKKTDTINTLAQTLYKEKVRYLTLQDKFNERWEEYKTSVSDLTFYSNDIGTDLTLSHWDSIEKGNVEDKVIEKIYREKDQYSKLSTSITSLNLASERIPHLATEESYTSLFTGVELSYRSAIRAINDLSSADKKVFSTTLAQIYKQIYGGSGLFQYKHKLISTERQLDQLENELLHLVGTLSDEFSLLISQYHMEAENIAESAHRYSNQLLTLALLFLVIFPVLLYYIFFKGLYRRIIYQTIEITNDIKDLANGQLDIEVKHYGFIELDNTANSLEVFKHNARELHKTSVDLQNKVKELSASNDELERFNYITSHDLKSPVHASQKLVEWIQSDKENQLSEESQLHLSLLHGRTLRLKKLLKDLSQYTKASKMAEKSASFDLESIIESIIALHDYSDEVNIHTNNSIIWAPPIAFEIVLRNLISNAVIHSESTTVDIYITVVNEEHFQIVSIKDNGPGIPLSLQKKAVQMFETLKPRDQTGGSGLGLTIVDKVVQRSNGKMELYSDGVNGTEVKTYWPVRNTFSTEATTDECANS